jgi:uncharacterized membrane protein YeaQ/YmgE (transglycosylase-associated protein family)
MLTILGWLIVGYIAGSVAEWLVPPASPQPGWRTVATGVAGSVVGGIAYAMLHGADYSPAGLVWSCGGAVLCVLAYQWTTHGGAT